MTGWATGGALVSLRVLELGEFEAAAYCGKLFADLGAEVIKVERPGGDPARRVGPSIPTASGEPESGYFAWLNTNKQSVTVSADDAGRLNALADACDIIVDGRAGEAAARWRGVLAVRRPATTIVSLSWFGESGPYRDYLADDLIVSALAGVSWPVGAAGEPPQPVCDRQAGIVGGLNAFTAALAARLGGAGRRFEVSLLEANLAISELYETSAGVAVRPERRFGRNRYIPTFPMGVYRCREGWIGVSVVTNDQWRGFCELLGLAEEAERPELLWAFGRFSHADELEATYAPRFLAHTASEWFAKALQMRLPCAIVPDMAELPTLAVHRERGAFADVEVCGARFEAPVLPQRLLRPRQPANGVAPGAGEHTDLWRNPAPRPATPEAAAGPGRPLQGVRIVDLTMGWAGPLATRQLGDLGAEVIKVESCGYSDWWRGSDPREAAVREHQFEKSAIFNAVNRNKKGITLDLTDPEGAALLRRLVATADAVIENYSQGVLPKLGLGHAALRAVNPSLVMVSMAAFGSGNPWSEARAYGSTLEHGAGVPMVAGCAGEPPTMTHLALGDPIGGLNAAATLLAALYHRARTGEGQHVDLSQVECLFPLVAAPAIEQALTGKVTRWGDATEGRLLRAGFRCLGEEAWVLASVSDAAAWARICTLAGRADLASVPVTAGKVAPPVAEVIEAWSSVQAADDVMAALQGVGVAAGVMRRPGELQIDPHLLDRGAWEWVDRPWIGVHSQALAAFREDGAAYPVIHPSPLLGEFNEDVLGGILGLSADEIAGLATRGVIGREPVATTRTTLRQPA
jgi:crotonobetainyl-CoA:carnitine CoA-transferase CaiB-like acyl-CoA transferase